MERGTGWFPALPNDNEIKPVGVIFYWASPRGPGLLSTAVDRRYFPLSKTIAPGARPLHSEQHIIFQEINSDLFFILFALRSGFVRLDLFVFS